MPRKGTWERKLWEDLYDLLATDSSGNKTLKVSFEGDSTDDTIDPGEVQFLHFQATLAVLEQLKIMNTHLSLMTDEEIKEANEE